MFINLSHDIRTLFALTPVRISVHHAWRPRPPTPNPDTIWIMRQALLSLIVSLTLSLIRTRVDVLIVDEPNFFWPLVQNGVGNVAPKILSNFSLVLNPYSDIILYLFRHQLWVLRLNN